MWTTSKPESSPERKRVKKRQGEGTAASAAVDNLRLIRALDRYPEARAAVVEALLRKK